MLLDSLGTFFGGPSFLTEQPRFLVFFCETGISFGDSGTLIDSEGSFLHEDFVLGCSSFAPLFATSKSSDEVGKDPC